MRYSATRLFTPVFLVCVALYFIVARSTLDTSPLIRYIVKTLPVLSLSLFAWLSSYKKVAFIPLALLFSAMGDWAGEMGYFIIQIILFAIAHICFIVYFTQQIQLRYLFHITTLLPIAIGLFMWTQLTAIENTHVRYAVYGYILIITTMAVTAGSQQSHYRYGYFLSACIFIISDTCIAWNRFIAPVPYAGTIIMTTYFIAQYLTTYLYIREQYKK